MHATVRFVQGRAEKLLNAGGQELGTPIAAQMRRYSLRALQLVIQDMAAEKYGLVFFLYNGLGRSSRTPAKASLHWRFLCTLT